MTLDATQPAGEVGTANEPPSELPVVPGYTLHDEVGRGGMGVVYRAYDEAIRREVAIKILHNQFAAHSATAARFVEEARITGQLQHPGIPPIYHVGTLANGRPFLAMKLIKGRTLDQLLKAQAPFNTLAVFEAVAQAVGYAHAHEVIHRDLKPANVMVGAFGEVQVMDWGLAKVLRAARGSDGRSPGDPEATTAETLIRSQRDTDGSQTQAGAVLGTPAYMAPEQAAGEVHKIDQRADVFGLGALLCVLLTGKPPFVGADAEGVRLNAVRGRTDEALARLEGSGAEPGVVALCRRCLSFEPSDRPADGNTVAEVVAGLRVAAEERARRAEVDKARTEVFAAEQTKRRRVLQWAGGALTLVLLAGLAASLWQMQRAITAEGLAKENEKKATEERDAKGNALVAEQKARWQAFAALQAMSDEVVEQQMARATTLTEENKMFLLRIVQQFDAFAAITGDDAESRWIRAEGRIRVGTMRYRLGDLKEANAAYTDGLSLVQQLVAEFPTRAEFRQALAKCCHNRGNLLRATGRPKEAEAAYTEAVTRDKELAADFPTRPEYRQDLAMSHQSLGQLLSERGRPKEAEAAFTEVLRLRKQVVSDRPTELEPRQQLARGHRSLGDLLSATGRLKEAEAAYAEALRLQKQMAATFPTHPELRHDLAESHNNLGSLLVTRGQVKQAEAAFREALTLFKQLAAEFPTRPEIRQNLAKGHTNLGNLLAGTGRLKEAEAAYLNALTLEKQLAADFPSRFEFRQQLAGSHSGLAGVLTDTGRVKEAEAAYNESLRLYKQLVAEFPDQPDLHNELAAVCVNVSGLCYDRGDFVAAKAHLREGEPHHAAALKANPRHPDYQQFYRNQLWALVAVHAALLEPAEAIRNAERIRDLGWDPPGNAYDAACAVSSCILLVGQHPKLDKAKRTEAARLYGDAAMKLLRTAIAKGFKDGQHLLADQNLAPLRLRADFQELAKSLRPAAKK
jgi:tetratricopeptide (TPR) repeat protein